MKNIIVSVIIACFCGTTLHGEVEQLVILGGGPAGLTSAIFAGQAHLNPLVIEGEEADGQYAAVYRIENFPGFPEGISGRELNDRLRQQAEIFGARMHCGEVAAIDLSQNPFHVLLCDGRELEAQSIVIATGASPKWLGLPSEEALIGKGISANALLDGPSFTGMDVVVVGGGDTAMEQALILTEYAEHVTVIYKGAAFYGSKYLQERALSHPKVSALLHTDVVDITDASQVRVTGVILRDVETQQLSEISCEGVIISNGRQPNTAIFAGQLEMTEAGYIVTEPDTTKASVEGVFVAGDIAQKAYRKMVTASASGCMSAIDAAKFLNAQKK